MERESPKSKESQFITYILITFFWKLYTLKSAVKFASTAIYQLQKKNWMQNLEHVLGMHKSEIQSEYVHV